MTGEMHERAGKVFRWPRAYDLLLHIIWGRNETQYRARLLQLAQVAPHQNMLDVGCGTGTLAIAAKKLVGSSGTIIGVDASKEMLAFARQKAARRGLAVEFVQASAQALPFAAGTFDVVICATVVHCLPANRRVDCFREMGRVLKPDGRLLVVDFGGSVDTRHSFFGHMNVHRKFQLADETLRLSEAGLAELAAGSTGFPDLEYILAARTVG